MYIGLIYWFAAHTPLKQGLRNGLEHDKKIEGSDAANT